MTLFTSKTWTMHSGEVSDFKIECDALEEGDWLTLAQLVAKRFKFRHVEGIPNGGLQLAQALDRFCDHYARIPLLIVDDVLTTGRSMEAARQIADVEGAVGVVVFSRGRCPSWIYPLFQMWG